MHTSQGTLGSEGGTSQFLFCASFLFTTDCTELVCRTSLCFFSSSLRWRREYGVCWCEWRLICDTHQFCLCSFLQVPLFIPVSFTIICLFTVAMSFYSDPVNISIGCAVVLSGFPVYYLIIRRQMSNRCQSPFCKYAFEFQSSGPEHPQG